MPQSIRRRLPAASTRYLEPVTVPAAPRKVSLGIGVSLYRRDRRSQCVEVQKVLKRKRQREVFEEKKRKEYRRKEARRNDNAEKRSTQRSAEKTTGRIASCRDGAQQCCAPTARYRTGMSARATG